MKNDISCYRKSAGNVNEMLFVLTFPVCIKFNVSYTFPFQDFIIADC